MDGTMGLQPPHYAALPQSGEALDVVDTTPTPLDHGSAFYMSHNPIQDAPPNLGAAGGLSGPFVFGVEDGGANINPWAESEDVADPWNSYTTWSFPSDPPPLQPLHSAVQAAFDGDDVLETDAAASSLPTGDGSSGEMIPTEPDLFDDLDYGSTGFQDADNCGLGFAADHLNYPVETFFTFWRLMWSHQKPNYPRISDYRSPNLRPKKITRREMVKNKCDFQGIYWSRYQVTKEQAREVRRMSYRNHVNMNMEIGQKRKDWGTEAYKVNFKSPSSPLVPSTEGYFAFRETSTRYKTSFRHYQLRHNISAASQNAIYYNQGGDNTPYPDFNTNLLHSYRNFTIVCYNPQSDSEEIVMDASKIKDEDGPVLDKISTLSADHGVLVVGSMSGVYGMKSLSTIDETPITVGAITPAEEETVTDNSTNHIHTILSRQSGLPQAVFNSNDLYIRILDCTTNKWINKHLFNSPVNCSVTDPSGRLRLLVCDDKWPVLADAETGEQLAKLPGHTDHGFACAWAPDGVTMATGYQDGIVQIWDARQLKEAVARIPGEQGGVRAMQFSPLGSGKPVLVLAEPADFVHVVDADTWASKQTIDFFGEIAGITMPPDGRNLYIANADAVFGGLMEFERTEMQSGMGWRKARRRLVREDLNDILNSVYGEDEGSQESVRAGWGRKNADWFPPSGLDEDERCLAARGHRWRRHMGLASLFI
ncbi:MAG: hypothetical protein Q9217_003199 [Psora testacea]